MISVKHPQRNRRMIVVGSSYWNIGIGREPGEVEKDAEGIGTVTPTLGPRVVSGWRP